MHMAGPKWCTSILPRATASYQGVHAQLFFSFVPSIRSHTHVRENQLIRQDRRIADLTLPVLPFTTLPACLAGRDRRRRSTLHCCCLLLRAATAEACSCCSLLCFFSSVSHPLSLNLTRFSCYCL
jgi:hypothetical protein